MLTVEIDPVAVEERLGSGRLACPGCSGVLAGWGSARGRQVRGTDAAMWIVPRRARCTGCRATHVLLPVVLLVRRADTAAVIGAGLTAKATGAGHRLIAALLGRPAETVRGWLRRFAGRGRGGPCGVHPVVSGSGCGSGAAGAGRVGVGGCHRRGPGRRRSGGCPVLHRRGAGLAGRVRGLRGPAAGPGLARSGRPKLINASHPAPGRSSS